MKKPITTAEVTAFLFGSKEKPSDKLPDDLAARLARHLEPIIARLQVIDTATRIGLNWQQEIARQSAKLAKIAAAWPKAKNDLAAPTGKAWCPECDDFVTVGVCTFGRCPIKDLKRKPPKKAMKARRSRAPNRSPRP